MRKVITRYGKSLLKQLERKKEVEQKFKDLSFDNYYGWFFLGIFTAWIAFLIWLVVELFKHFFI